MAEVNVKRARCANLTVGERSLLIDLVISHFDIIENKQTDAVTISKKNQTWRVLTAQFNAHSGLMNRTKENLKAAWENMKRLARRMDRMERECTGGGPPKKKREDPLLEKVLLLIQPGAVGYNSIDYDPGESQGDDMGMEMPEVETTMEEDGSMMDKADHEDNKLLFQDQMHDYMDNPMEARNTIENTPNLMRAPMSDCLRVGDGLEPVGETPLQRAKIEALNRQYHMALQERDEMKEINRIKLEVEREKLKQERLRTKLLILELRKRRSNSKTYAWLDEKGKKTKVAAPQYIDYVMTFTQKTLSDESIFPTKYANDFPSTFESTVRKILRLLFHVLAHLYHCHFREVVLLNLHAHLNCVFAHLTLFNSRFALIDSKETEILHDLVVALKIHNPDEEMAVDASVPTSTSTTTSSTTTTQAAMSLDAAQDSSQSASSSATATPLQRRSSRCEDNFLQCEVPLLKEPLLSHPETVAVGSVSLVQ